MLPDQYAEGDDRYGGDEYADERYGTGGDVGGERYGVAGGDQYGGGVLVYGGADEGYMALVDGDGVYAVPAGAVGYDASADRRYAGGASVDPAFAVELPEEWMAGSDRLHN